MSVEILAPVGSFESLTAAIQAGADSIYFGVEQLNMRVRSSAPFTINDIPKIAEQARSKSIKKYLTLNTTLYDHDKNLCKEIINTCIGSGVNAIIASDFAVINECQKRGIPVHISTQANVANIDAVEFFSSYADVVVLSRELTLKQIEDISNKIKKYDIKGPSGNRIKIEIFVHGALCMAISGKCYLSLHSNNSSANRGACIQNCRHPYIVTDKETQEELVIDNEYIMSSKDLCTIDILDKIVNTGVSILKIEGRGRSADYVYKTVKCYKEAIQSIKGNSYSKEKIDKWKQELSGVYNRGFWEGYYLGRKMGEWSDTGGSKATQKKIYIGHGVRYFPKMEVAEFRIETGSLQIGDEVLLIGPKTGIVYEKINSIHVDNTPVDKAEKGVSFSIPFKTMIHTNDKLYKLITTEYA